MDTKKLRQKILDLAIHGKLVPQDPNDEPASVLLERIRAEKECLISEGKIKRSRKTVKTSDTPHYEQDVPFEVPAGWKLIALEEIFILNPKNEVDDETLAGFIPMALVDDGFCGSHSFEQELWKNIKKGFSHFQNGDIGIAKISPCFENMKSVIFNNLPNGLGAGTTELTILRGILIDVKFYLYLFKTSWYINQGTKYFKGVVGQQRVNKAIFTTLEVPLPPLAEQRRIVAEIERWFTLIDAIEQGKENLETSIKQAKGKILDLAIHGKLVPQDPNDEPASELLKRINPKAQSTCDNEHSRKLPYNWCLCNLGDVCMLENGFAFSSDQYKAKGTPLIRISNIKDNEISLSSCVFINEGYEEKYIVHSGDLLIAMSGATTGKMGIYNQKYVAYLNQRVGNIKIVDSNLLFDKYRNYFLFSQKNKILELAYGGAQPNISGKVINSLFVPLPPLAEQKRIVKKIEELFLVIDTVEQALQA